MSENSRDQSLRKWPSLLKFSPLTPKTNQLNRRCGGQKLRLESFNELQKPENSVLATKSKTVPTFKNNNEFIPPVSREGTVYYFSWLLYNQVFIIQNRTEVVLVMKCSISVSQRPTVIISPPLTKNHKIIGVKTFQSSKSNWTTNRNHELEIQKNSNPSNIAKNAKKHTWRKSILWTLLVFRPENRQYSPYWQKQT